MGSSAGTRISETRGDYSHPWSLRWEMALSVRPNSGESGSVAGGTPHTVGGPRSDNPFTIIDPSLKCLTRCVYSVT